VILGIVDFLIYGAPEGSCIVLTSLTTILGFEMDCNIMNKHLLFSWRCWTMKCKKCGKGIGLTRRGKAIADGYICYKCLDELGFSKQGRGVKRWTLSYWEIKDGPDRIQYNRAARQGKHEDWLRAHPDAAAFFDELEPGDDEEAEIVENNED
jgi:hypothetical protein